MFHSLAYGLNDGSDAIKLRRDLCQCIATTPMLMIAQTPLYEWIQWETNGQKTHGQYAASMSKPGQWGGGIEMAVFSLLKGVNVHVYEKNRPGVNAAPGYTRVAAFDYPSTPELRKTVRVCYRGRNHYDALVLDGPMYHNY